MTVTQWYVRIVFLSPRFDVFVLLQRASIFELLKTSDYCGPYVANDAGKRLVSGMLKIALAEKLSWSTNCAPFYLLGNVETEHSMRMNVYCINAEVCHNRIGCGFRGIALRSIH